MGEDGASGLTPATPPRTTWRGAGLHQYDQTGYAMNQLASVTERAERSIGGMLDALVAIGVIDSKDQGAALQRPRSVEVRVRDYVSPEPPPKGRFQNLDWDEE